MRISYFNKLDGGSNKIFNWRSHSWNHLKNTQTYLRLDANHGGIMFSFHVPKKSWECSPSPNTGGFSSLVRWNHRTGGRIGHNAGVSNTCCGFPLQRHDGSGLFPIPLKFQIGANFSQPWTMASWQFSIARLPLIATEVELNGAWTEPISPSWNQRVFYFDLRSEDDLDMIDRGYGAR